MRHHAFNRVRGRHAVAWRGSRDPGRKTASFESDKGGARQEGRRDYVLARSQKGKCIDVRETDRIQASTLFSISESNHLICTILGQAQSGIPTFAESKFIHVTELSNHARTGPSPLARPPARPPAKGLSIRLSNLHSTQTNSTDGRTMAAGPAARRRRHKLTPTATAALLARSPSPSLSPSSARQSNPILPERVSGHQTDRPRAAVRGADFFFHRSLRGKGRRGDER